jgi:hypothetical protein
MGQETIPFPFEVPPSRIQQEPEVFVSSIFSCLESEFMTLPKGSAFVEYEVFHKGYEALKQGTDGFAAFLPDPIIAVIRDTPISFVVLRSILGFTPSEWAYLTTQETAIAVSQGAARSMDRKVREHPCRPMRLQPAGQQRLEALVQTACRIIAAGVDDQGHGTLHRMDKADTRSGTEGIRSLSQLGVPYAVLLYERFLGRPFAGHRDSVSELVGDTLEVAIEKMLADAGVSYRKTKRAERIRGFDQAPDFVVPDEFRPKAVIEAKVTEDDGTARDKVTRIQHLAEVRRQWQAQGGSVSARGSPPRGPLPAPHTARGLGMAGVKTLFWA